MLYCKRAAEAIINSVQYVAFAESENAIPKSPWMCLFEKTYSSIQNDINKNTTERSGVQTTKGDSTSSSKEETKQEPKTKEQTSPIMESMVKIASWCDDEVLPPFSLARDTIAWEEVRKWAEMTFDRYSQTADQQQEHKKSEESERIQNDDKANDEVSTGHRNSKVNNGKVEL